MRSSAWLAACASSTRSPGIEQAIARGVAYAPYADVVWCETSTPDLDQAERFAGAVHERHPGKLLAYNCSPSFNWKANLSEEEIAVFQDRLGELGYRDRGMGAYAALQQREFESQADGYTAVEHQREVGAAYFEEVALVIAGGETETTALRGSTEESQF